MSLTVKNGTTVPLQYIAVSREKRLRILFEQAFILQRFSVFLTFNLIFSFLHSCNYLGQN